LSVANTKLGIVALLAGLLVVFAILRPGAPAPVAEADLGTPGGISALPSAAPGFPGVANQGIPAIIRAREPGNRALVTVFCDPKAAAPLGLQGKANPCADQGEDRSFSIDFEMTRVYPPDGVPSSSFTATDTQELSCGDNKPCDLSSGTGEVVVEVQGGGVNEIVEVRATDEIGESRTVQIVVVDTILGWGPTGAVTTASQESPAFVSYACDNVGAQLIDPASLAAVAEDKVNAPPLPSPDRVVGLNDIWELLYGAGSGLKLGNLANSLQGEISIPLYWCGGDTAALYDDFVDFQTDKGIFTVDPAATDIALGIADVQAAFGLTLPPSLDYDCGEGKDVNVFDIDALAVWGAVLQGMPVEGGCDADFARNGVVTTMVLGTGEVGVATITAQQGGGVSPPRTINITFVGEAALSVFIEAPKGIGTDGGEFSVIVVDQAGRPVGGETVECSVEPTGGALVVVPQTGTTADLNSDSPGEVTLKLVPTGASVVAGEELTLTCVLDRDHSVSASTSINLSSTPGLDMVSLAKGCVLVGSTWEDGTPVDTVAAAVSPADALDAMWAFDPVTGTWLAFSPVAPAGVSDLTSVDRLQAFFVCMSEAGTIGRPVL